MWRAISGRWRFILCGRTSRSTPPWKTWKDSWEMDFSDATGAIWWIWPMWRNMGQASSGCRTARTYIWPGRNTRNSAKRIQNISRPCRALAKRPYRPEGGIIALGRSSEKDNVDQTEMREKKWGLGQESEGLPHRCWTTAEGRRWYHRQGAMLCWAPRAIRMQGWRTPGWAWWTRTASWAPGFWGAITRSWSVPPLPWRSRRSCWQRRRTRAAILRNSPALPPM